MVTCDYMVTYQLYGNMRLYGNISITCCCLLVTFAYISEVFDKLLHILSLGAPCDNGCSVNADCITKATGQICVCKDGFSGDGANCTSMADY